MLKFRKQFGIVEIDANPDGIEETSKGLRPYVLFVASSGSEEATRSSVVSADLVCYGGVRLFLEKVCGEDVEKLTYTQIA